MCLNRQADGHFSAGVGFTINLWSVTLTDNIVEPIENVILIASIDNRITVLNQPELEIPYKECFQSSDKDSPTLVLRIELEER